MSTTPNYGLYVTDDVKEKVKELLEKMSNTTDSNMVKIDTALGEKADHSSDVTLTLMSSGWSGVSAPYTYELSVAGLKANQNGHIEVAHSATFEQRQMAREAILCVTGQSDGKIIISADGEMPELDIPVTIVMLD